LVNHRVKTISANTWNNDSSTSTAQEASRELLHIQLWPRGGQWLMVLALGMILIGLVEFADLRGVPGAGLARGSVAHELIGYSNLLLIGSTILYVGHLWFDAKIVGRSASGMATLGTVGCLVALSRKKPKPL